MSSSDQEAPPPRLVQIDADQHTGPAQQTGTAVHPLGLGQAGIVIPLAVPVVIPVVGGILAGVRLRPVEGGAPGCRRRSQHPRGTAGQRQQQGQGPGCQCCRENLVLFQWGVPFPTQRSTVEEWLIGLFLCFWVSGGRFYGIPPGGYSSFACERRNKKVFLSLLAAVFPAANRGVILLSSEDFRQPAGRLFFFRGQFLYFRQLAGGLFFFRRRKKNQERRHPFERVDDDLGALPPRPPPTIDGRPSHHRLLPALPCRPGETSGSSCDKLEPFLCRLLTWSSSFCRCGKTCTPGPQGGPGRSR